MLSPWRKIWKYEISVQKSTQICIFSIDMPEGAQPLCVREQFGKNMLWALVDPEREMSPKLFLRVGTGSSHSFDVTKVRYIDTYFEVNQRPVWHLFELLVSPDYSELLK
jgi:hypothetical protein